MPDPRYPKLAPRGHCSVVWRDSQDSCWYVFGWYCAPVNGRADHVSGWFSLMSDGVYDLFGKATAEWLEKYATTEPKPIYLSMSDEMETEHER